MTDLVNAAGDRNENVCSVHGEQTKKMMNFTLFLLRISVKFHSFVI